MLLDTLKVLKLGMGNPASRAVVMLGDMARNSGSSRLELALRSFAFNESTGDFIDRAYSLIVTTVLNVGCRTFDTRVELIKEYLRDPIVRRAVALVLGSIAFYGVTRPQLLKAPFLVVWNLTNACNLKCKHCYQSAGKRLSDELSLKEKLGVVGELADAGVVSVAFSGGEPLVNPDFLTVAREAREHGMHVALATNGTLITPETARQLKKIDICYVEVSLDAASANLHDTFRGVLGAHYRSIEGIRNCVKEGIFTCIATTVTKKKSQRSSKSYRSRPQNEG